MDGSKLPTTGYWIDRMNCFNTLSKKHLLIASQLCMLSALVCASSSYAEEEGVQADLELSVTSDNNIFRVNQQASSDTFFTLSPTFKLREKYKSLILDGQYQGDYRIYSDHTDLNFTEHDVALRGTLEHTAKFNTEVAARYHRAIEEPGTTNALTSELTEFNQTTNTSFTFAATYGTLESIGQVTLAYDAATRRYDNNQQAFRNYDTDKITGTFYYRAAPKTRLLIEASVDELDYQDVETFDPSSSQNRYLLGVEWTATAKTRSVFKLGYQDIDYHDPLFNDISGLAYFLDVYWKPKTYTLVKLGASRSTRESAIANSPSFVSTTYSVGVAHEFGARTKLDLDYQYRQDDLSGREDTLENIEARLNYSLKRDWQLYLAFEMNKRDSDLTIFNFDSNLFTLGINAQFN